MDIYPIQNQIKTYWKSSVYIFLITLISRLAFLNEGYGMDPDAWRIVSSALQLDEDGIYEVSRFPGYPVVEYLNSIWVGHGVFITNFATAAVSALACAGLYVFFSQMSLRHSFIAALSFSFVPIVFISSTAPMDHMWAFCFFIWAMCLLQTRYWKTSAILLGLAMASRITYGAMLVPCVLLLSVQQKEWESQTRIRPRLFFYSALSLVSGALFFSPVFYKYGLDFLQYYQGHPPLKVLAYRLSVGVWGVLGCFGLMILGGIFLRNKFLGRMQFKLLFHSDNPQKILMSFGFIIVLYLCIFLKLPEDSAYLIPSVAFFLYFIYANLSARLGKIFFITIFLSNFIFHVNKNGFLLRGSILQDQFDRQQSMQYLEKVIEKLKTRSQKPSVVVAGYWLPMLQILQKHATPTISTKTPDNVPILVYELNKNKVQEYLTKDYDLFVLRDQNKNNLGIYPDTDLLQMGAVEL